LPHKLGVLRLLGFELGAGDEVSLACGRDRRIIDQPVVS
jgi:hypothetical protein